jgi:hypothetical protein
VIVGATTAQNRWDDVQEAAFQNHGCRSRHRIGRTVRDSRKSAGRQSGILGLSYVPISGTRPAFPDIQFLMKTGQKRDHRLLAPTKAHSTTSWTRNMSASGKGHRRHPSGGAGGQDLMTLRRGGSTHLA